MKNFIEAAQYAFAALGGALGAVMGGFDAHAIVAAEPSASAAGIAGAAG